MVKQVRKVGLSSDWWSKYKSNKNLNRFTCSLDFHLRKWAFVLATSMMVTDIGDKMCWWQLVTDNYKMLVTVLSIHLFTLASGIIIHKSSTTEFIKSRLIAKLSIKTICEIVRRVLTNRWSGIGYTDSG